MENQASPKIRALIVDDEPPARANLRVLLGRDPRMEIIGECGSGMEAVAAIRISRPDLVFLDVQMPECDGFDVLEMLGSEMPRAIVFVTAYDQFALRAFDAGALDYLLKPFDNQRFELALSRALDRLRRDHATPKRKKRLAIKSGGQVLFLAVEEVDWVEAADYYSCLHVGGRRHLIRRSMAELDDDLSADIFCRIHRSTIVNLNRVRALESGEEGEHEVVLQDGIRLRLSRRYRKELQSRLASLAN